MSAFTKYTVNVKLKRCNAVCVFCRNVRWAYFDSLHSSLSILGAPCEGNLGGNEIQKKFSGPNYFHDRGWDFFFYIKWYKYL